MKKVLFVFIVILCTLSLQANVEGSVYRVGEKTFAIDLSKDFGSIVQVTIRDLNGKIVYKETKSPEYLMRRKYNLKKLPQGEYLVYIQNEKKTLVQSVDITSRDILINHDEEKVFFSPYITLKNQSLDLNYLSLTPTKMSVRIVDGSGELAFEENDEVQGNVQKRFNLSALPAGDYTITTSINDGLVNHNFSTEVFLEAR